MTAPPAPTVRVVLGRGRLWSMTVAMKSTNTTWEMTLAALLPFGGRRLQATTLVDDYPVSAFGGVLHRVDLDDEGPSGVEVAELDFEDGRGYVLLRRDEHRGSTVDCDGGVLRALEARSISGQEFTRQNGFFVKFDIAAGGPFNPELLRGGGLQRGIAEAPPRALAGWPWPSQSGPVATGDDRIARPCC